MCNCFSPIKHLPKIEEIETEMEEAVAQSDTTLEWLPHLMDDEHYDIH